MRRGYVAIPNALVDDSKVPGSTKLLFIVLKRFAFGKKTECHPSQQELARRLGVSVRTVQRGIGRLVEAGLIGVRVIATESGISNIYDLSSGLSRYGDDNSVVTQATNLASPPRQKCRPNKTNGIRLREQHKTAVGLIISPGERESFDLLVSRGVAQETARELARSIPPGHIGTQVQALASRSGVRDPAAYLVATLRRGCVAPALPPPAETTAELLAGLPASRSLQIDKMSLEIARLIHPNAEATLPQAQARYAKRLLAGESPEEILKKSRATTG